MLTLSSAKDNLHIVEKINFPASAVNYYGYSPVTTGEFIPTFYLPAENGITKPLAPTLMRETLISLQDFLDYQQPLAIAFLGAPGQAAADIAKLEKLQADIQEAGGKLLLFTAVEPKYLRRQLRGSGSLTLFYDKDNAIAELFGLYDQQNPLWQWVSGIEEEEQLLPALYVIAPDRKIVYSYIDYNFGMFANNVQVWHKDLLHAVQGVSQQYHYHPEAYKLVS